LVIGFAEALSTFGINDGVSGFDFYAGPKITALEEESIWKSSVQ